MWNFTLVEKDKSEKESPIQKVVYFKYTALKTGLCSTTCVGVTKCTWSELERSQILINLLWKVIYVAEYNYVTGNSQINFHVE